MSDFGVGLSLCVGFLLLLMQFLDCVDRRDGKAAAKLFYPDALWSTASSVGDIEGSLNIEKFINLKLPPRKYGPEYKRHRMESPAGIDDLTVVTPTGERSRFRIETDTLQEGSRSGTKIRSLMREVL